MLGYLIITKKMRRNGAQMNRILKWLMPIALLSGSMAATSQTYTPLYTYPQTDAGDGGITHPSGQRYQVTTQVPAGAVTGPIAVTLRGGTRDWRHPLVALQSPKHCRGECTR
jgi:hypothetical protein